MALLGSRTLAVGDIRRVEIDYTEWLLRGATIHAVTATVITAGATSTVSGATLDKEQNKALFFAHAGVLNENFTVQVQVTDTLGQIVNDTLDFTVVTP